MKYVGECSALLVYFIQEGKKKKTKKNLISKYFPSYPPSNLPKPQQIQYICRVFSNLLGNERKRIKLLSIPLSKNTAHIAYGI